MTQEEKIINGLDKDLKRIIDVEMNDPVIGKLLNRNAAYVLGKEIKLVLIERVCEWLDNELPKYIMEGRDGKPYISVALIDDLKKAMYK